MCTLKTKRMIGRNNLVSKNGQRFPIQENNKNIFSVDYAAVFWYSLFSRVTAMAFACWSMQTKAVLTKKFLVPLNSGDLRPLLSIISPITDSIPALLE